jgi:hypothetical protein
MKDYSFLFLIILFAAVGLFLFMSGQKISRADCLRIDLTRNEVRTIASIDAQMARKYGSG